MSTLTSDEVKEIALRTRKLPDYDIDAYIQKAQFFSQKIRAHESITNEEQVAFLKIYAFIRDIARLKPYVSHLSKLNISEKKVQQCNEIVSTFEEQKHYSIHHKMGLFEKSDEQRVTRDEVENLFARLSSTNIMNLNYPRPKK